MRPFLLLLSLMPLACGGADRLVQTGSYGEAPAPPVAPVDSPDAAVTLLTAFAGPDGPPCCDSAGNRVTSAQCSEGVCRCAVGAFCVCQGAPAGFLCTDFCGSDAVMDPECSDTGYTCPRGFTQTNSCPSGTCWGEPGDCCVNPSCVDGAWRCAEIADGGGC